ncbi:MAG: phage tail tape measure protein, partial [Clostridia bacterium]
MSDAFDILVGAALKEGSVDDAIQELKNKLAQESNKVKVDLGIKGVDGKDKSSGTKSEVSAAKELKSTYSSIGQLLNQNEKRQLQIKNITTSVAETNQKVLRYQQEYNEKTGKLTDPAKASLMVKRTDELKQKYDSMLANLRERAKLEERLIKIKGQGKVKEEEVLQTQIKSSKIAYDELKADADKLKLSKGITTQTTEEIALSREKLRIEQQMAQLSARSQDKANNQLVNQLYKESLSSLKQIDALSKKIAQAEATKSKEYEKQLRLQRQSLQAKVDENNKILEQVASENSKLNISAQQDALAKRQLTNEKNIAVYKQQALSTLKATKGVFSGFVNELKIAVTRSIEWGIAMGALYGSVRKLKDGVQFLIDVDTSLTEIAMVTQQSREEVQGLTQDYLDLAKALKISTKEIFDSAVSLYRQGLSADEVNSRLQTLSQTSKVTGESITTVTDYVTAGVNTLGVEANRFNDILIKTASIAGTTYGELGEAISKNAASFNNANVNLEKITSYMATILETTREAPQSVGTFGKTLVGRFQRINKATGELNEDLNAVQKAMESVGVDFLDAAGQIRPVSDILDDLSKTWDTLDGNTQKYLATQAGGLRQGNRFIALMDNYQRSMDIYGEALDSSGTTQEQYNKYLESTQALIDELRVTWEDLYITVLNSDWIKVFYRTLIELVKYLEVAVENIDFVIAAFGGFVIINKIIPTLSLLSKFLVGGEFAKYGKSVSTVVSHLDKLKDGGNAAAGSASTLLTKISSLNPVIMAASAAVGLLAYAFLDAKKKAKEFEEGQRELQKTLEQGSVQDIKNTINNIENLKSKYDSLTAEQESLRKGNEDLSPAWDNTAQKLSKVDDEIQSVIDEMRKYGINTKNIDSELERLNNTLEGKTKALEKEKAEVERLSGIYEDHLDMIKDYDEAQLKSHKELLLQKKAEVEVLKNSITAWAEYTKSRMGAANIPIMPSREDFPAPHDFNQEMKNFRNEMFVFAQDPFSSFGATTANMIDMASQEKIKEVQKNIDGIDAQIDAVNQRLEDWAINHTKVSDDTEDNLTIDDVWEDKVDSIIEQLEREKE